MFRVLNIVLFLFICTSFAQENENNYSFYFKSTGGDELKGVSNVDDIHFGKYSLKKKTGNESRIAAGDNLVVDMTGIAIEKNRLIAISREEIRENSKYWINDGYLFGVVDNDSVQVLPSGDNYVFLFPVKTYLFEVGKTSKIFYGSSKSEYIILTAEDNGFMSSISIQFSSSGINIKELSFEEGCSLSDINKKELIEGDDFNTYILNPSKKEWALLFGCYITYDSYTTYLP